MTNYKRRYTALLRAAAETLEPEQVEAILRRAQVPQENDPFMEALIPFTDDQLDALWGDVPMTEECYYSILYNLGHWNDLNAITAMLGRYPQFGASYDDAIPAARQGVSANALAQHVKDLYRDVGQLWETMQQKKI